MLETNDMEIDLNFDRYPTLLKFNRSAALVRGVIGPAGSAKTTYGIKDLVIRSMLQAPAPQDKTRYTRWVVIRNTRKQLESNTLESFKLALGPLLAYTRIVRMPQIKATWQMDLPDGTSLFSEWLFAGMDDEKAIGDALGAEVTGGIIDEASQIPETIPNIILTRVGRYPSSVRGTPSWRGLILTSNGPKENHWLYEWSIVGKPEWKQWEERNPGKKYFELFQQPPALLRPENEGGDWKENPEAENIHNLDGGYDYYYKMLGNDDDMVIAYVEGKFSKLRTGKVVYPEFRRKIHIIPRARLRLTDGAPVVLSFDFGRTPVCLVGIVTGTGRIIIIDEVAGTDMAIETLVDGQLLPLLKQRYPRMPVANAWGDPAGADGQQNTELTPFGVLQARNIPINVPWDTRNKLEPRIAAVRRRLMTLASDGLPMLQITDNCKILIAALEDGYIYESVRGKADVYKEVPTKSHVNWVSDIANAAEYLCLGFDSLYGISDAKKNETNDPRVKEITRKHLVRY